MNNQITLNTLLDAHTEQEQLKKITKVILSKIETEKIICFGSITRKVESSSCFITRENPDNPVLNSYYFLVVPKKEEHLADYFIQQRLEQETKHLANLTVLAHRVNDINRDLRNNGLFFKTIYQKGLLLYDDQKEFFIFPSTNFNKEDRMSNREKLWNKWLEISENFLTGAQFYAHHNNYGLAMFMLHQTMKHCYCGMIKVLTGYQSESNGLARLLKLAENVVPDAPLEFSQKTPEDARLTRLLLNGFSNGRYNEKYKATKEEAGLLISRIEKILAFADRVCKERINSLQYS